jgi:hypothetical protein
MRRLEELVPDGELARPPSRPPQPPAEEQAEAMEVAEGGVEAAQAHEEAAVTAASLFDETTKAEDIAAPGLCLASVRV